MNDSQYYMRVRGRVQGPFDQEKLQNFSRRGQLSRMHEVSTDGINWTRASNFPELFVGSAVEPVVEPVSSAALPETTAVPESSTPRDNVTPPPASVVAPALAASTGVPERPQWWYSIQGKQQGPIDLAALQHLTASGQLGQQDFVWKSGMTGWRAAAEISGLTFASVYPPRSDFQSLGASQNAAPTETIYGAALALRPHALLLAIILCLAAGGCCLWSLWQFYGAAARDARSGWSLALGASGLIESGILAAVAILLSVHAGRLAALRHSRQPIVLEKALTALRPFWLLAALALLIGLVLISLHLATLADGATHPAAAA